MYILGIHPTHNGTACLLKDGKVIGCVSEERFNRVKNYWGFPTRSIKYLLNFAKISAGELDLVVVAGKFPIGLSGSRFDMNKILSKKKGPLMNFFGYISYKNPNFTNGLINFKHKYFSRYSPRKEVGILEETKENLSNLFNIDKQKILILDHHFSHAYSTCFNLPANKKTLVFTLDGEGDNAVCATVNIFDGEGMKRIAETKKHASLGFLYALITKHLGMKPNEHEFKVMGLAPYAKQHKIEEEYDEIKKILKVSGLNFISKFRMQYADYFLRDKMKNVRFDKLAASIQKLTEELLCQWIKNGIEKTGISSIALAGGVAMNVKACQKILEMPEVKDFFVVPSAGDESTAIGACFYGYKEFCKTRNLPFHPKPLEDLYLGPEYSDEEIEIFLKDQKISEKYNIKKYLDIEKEVAKLLAKGEIVARLKGRSEFGARALGNRSILTDPSNKSSVQVLNELIKDRDFWMPFTPSMLKESGKEYLVNKRKMPSPYMAITFNSTSKARDHLAAAMHPYDFTIRPQLVYKEWNPDYHKLITYFKKLRGIGAVLNTSFNLHGEPNVLDPKDALHTFENSGLKYLALGNFLISKF